MPEQYSATWKLARVEHWIAFIGGGALVIYGLVRGSFAGFLLALLGSDLVYHGLLHKDPHIHQVFGLELPPDRVLAAAMPDKERIRIQRSITINRSPEDLYRFWRKLENWPRVFDFVHSVRTSDRSRSHWSAKSPSGVTIEWDVEITEDIPNQLITWRSTAESSVSNTGSVHLSRSPSASGTRVNITLEYDLAPGPIREAFAELLGEMPSQTVRGQLSRLKHLLESEGLGPIRSSLRTRLESR